MKKNVILIVVDALRADRLSCYGYGKKTSPYLDEFAREGVMFGNLSKNDVNMAHRVIYGHIHRIECLK